MCQFQNDVPPKVTDVFSEKPMNLAPNIDISSKVSHLEDQGDQAVWWAQAHLPNEGFGLRKKLVGLSGF